MLTAELRFCPVCGVALGGTPQRFCVSCGAELPFPRPSTSDESSDVRAAPGFIEPAVAAPVGRSRSDEPSRTGPTTAAVNDWSELSESARAAVYPIAGWLVISLLAAYVLADQFSSAIGGQISAVPGVAQLLGAFVSGSFGLVASLFAGLAYHVGLNLTGSSFGFSSSGNVEATINGVALGSLLVIGYLAFRGFRASVRRRSLTGLSAIVTRAALVAAFATAAMFIGATVVGSFLAGSVNSNVGLGVIGVSLGGAISGGPVPAGLVSVTFPVLFASCVVGAFSVVGLHGFTSADPRSPSNRVAEGAIAALGGYLVAIVILSVIYIVAAIAW